MHYALPVLARYGFGATVFPLAARLGGVNTWDPAGPRKPLMTARQVRQAAEAGMEIGSHGLRHISLPSASGAALTAELENSRAVLQAASGQPVAGFCYPFGDADKRVVAAVRRPATPTAAPSGAARSPASTRCRGPTSGMWTPPGGSGRKRSSTG